MVVIGNDTLKLSSIKISDFTYFLNNERENSNFKFPYLDLFSVKKIPNKLLAEDTLIIDMRGYPNTPHINRNIYYFFEKTNLGFIEVSRKNPGSFIKKSTIKKGKLKNPNQIVYALVNSYTGSYSEILCLLIKSNPNVKFVGTETSNAFGIYDSKLRLLLPENVKFNTTKKGVLFNNQLPYSIKGINPKYGIEVIQNKYH